MGVITLLCLSITQTPTKCYFASAKGKTQIISISSGAVSCDGDILNDSSRYMWADIDGDLCSCHEYITESCLNYILSSLNYSPEIGLFEGTKKS